MRRISGYLSVLSILMILLLPSVPANDGNSAVAVFITYQLGDFGIGSQVNLTVHVLRYGAFYKPANLQLRSLTSGKDIPFEETGIGKYSGKMTIDAFEIDYDECVHITAIADGSMNDLPVPTIYSDLTVRILWLSGPEDEIIPGKPMDLETQIILNGRLTDPDPGTLRTYITTSSDNPFSMYQSHSLESTKIATGRYKCTYQPPANQDFNAGVEIRAVANYTFRWESPFGPVNRTKQIFSGITEAPLDFFNIWLNIMGQTGSDLDVGLHVLGKDGSPVPMADLSLEYSDPSSGRTYGHDSPTADAEGFVRVAMPMPIMTGGGHAIQIKGVCEALGFVQDFEYILDWTGTSQRSSWDHPTNSLYFTTYGVTLSQNGSAATLSNTLSNFQGVGLKGQNLFINVRTDNEFLLTTNVTTDSDGRFEFQIPVPGTIGEVTYPSPLHIYYQTEIDGVPHTDDQRYLYPINPVLENSTMPMGRPVTSVTHGPMEPGCEIDFNISHPFLDGREEVVNLIWGMNNPREHERVNWTLLNDIPPYRYGGYARGSWQDGAYRVRLDLPDCLDDGTLVYISPEIDLLDTSPWELSGPIHVIRVDKTSPRQSIAITSPRPGDYLHGTLTSRGTAFDAVGIEKVEVRIDQQAWEPANGTSIWYYVLDTTVLTHGPHNISARSFNGSDYSEVVTVEFPIDQPPSIEIIEPSSNMTLQNETVTMGIASDDVRVERVEVRADGAEWIPASLSRAETNPSCTWSLTINTSSLSNGLHSLNVRAYDGHMFSRLASVGFRMDRHTPEPDPKPSVSIVSPSDGATYGDDLKINGTASDDRMIVSVEVRMDGGDWQSVLGATHWSFPVAVEDIPPGEHVLEARAFDGSQYSDIAMVRFTKEKAVISKSSIYPILMLLLMLLVFLIALIFRLRSSGPKD